MRAILVLLLFLAVSCGGPGNEGDTAKSGPQKAEVTPQFVDATAGAGIDFTHYNGAYGKKYFPEMNGPGGGWLDFDGDGLPPLALLEFLAASAGESAAGAVRAAAGAELVLLSSVGDFADAVVGGAL